jgi:hypothetical protein
VLELELQLQLELAVMAEAGHPRLVLVLGPPRGVRMSIPLGDGEDLALHPDEELKIEDDDDLRDDAVGSFRIDLGDGTQPIDLNGDDDGVEPSTNTHLFHHWEPARTLASLVGRITKR